jgi:PAS domain-containing protein
MQKGPCPTREQLSWLLERLAVPTCLLDEQARIVEADTRFADLFDLAVGEVRWQTLQSLANRLLDANGEVISDPYFPLSMRYRGQSEEVVFAWKKPGIEKVRSTTNLPGVSLQSRRQQFSQLILRQRGNSSPRSESIWPAVEVISSRPYCFSRGMSGWWRLRQAGFP